jgi:two-component system chemotaxis response regulator CheY
MKTIFLVDDSMTILMSMKGILEKEGYQVKTAKDGQDAIDQLKAGLRPNLIITDLNMPRKDGIEFIREAKAQASLRFTPIIILTTESGGARKDEARAAGEAGWLVKPVVPAQLMQVVKQVCP